MVLDNISTPTIYFFMYAWPYLQRERGISCTELARKVKISPQCARKHIQKLERLNYTFRVNYRAWRLAENPLRDKDLSEMRHLAISHGIIKPSWSRRIN
jgi:DNA-binding Lrp family transcriptional regulator